MEIVNLKIGGIAVTAPKGSIILGAVRLAHIEIPTLCFLKKIDEIGTCRIYVVELKNGELVIPCVYSAEEGMEVYTNTPKVLGSREKTLQPLLSNRNRSCLSYVRSGRYEPQELVHELGADDEGYYDGEITPPEIDISAAHMIHDDSKCILCRRCMTVCEDIQGTDIIGANNRSFSTPIGSAFEMGLGETFCVPYGQYIAVCPTGALTKKDYTADIFAAIADPKRHIIVQTVSAVRAGLGEEFGLPIGTGVEGKMAAALRRLGFDKVFDTNFSANLTTMEEAHEFIDQVQNGGVLPLITSYSPDWAKCCEHYFPDMTENLSSCKSPQQMFGAVAKSYYVKKAGIDPKDVVSVGVMPCTAKGLEISHEDEDTNGMPDMDISVITKGLARMIRKTGIRFLNLPDEEFGAPLGLETGATVVFGATGGVMRATLRTAVEVLTGEELPKPGFVEVRGAKGIKEATYNMTGMEVKITAASGLGNARELSNKARSGEANYHFIEIIGCPGGCVNSGGQPQQPRHVRSTTDIRNLHARVLYGIGTANPIHKPHESPTIKKFYATYLGEPGDEEIHYLFHTTYVKRSINQY